MIRLRLVKLLFCFIGSCLLVIFLQAFSTWKQNSNNGFIRLLPSHKITGLESLDLKSDTYYICGVDSTAVYLALRSYPERVLMVKFNHENPMFIKLSGFENLKFYQGAYVRVEASNVHLFEGIKPMIALGALRSARFTDVLRSPHFTAALPISRSSYILRVVKGMQNHLIKLNQNGVGLSLLLEKQGEGIFSTDGSLVKADGNDRFFYVFNYRNQFLALDTNLNLLYKGRTRDTISQSQIKVSRISSEHKITMSAPPLVVNKGGTANNRYLFVHSAMKADNETESMHAHATAIDVYDVKDGNYQFSFYLSDYNGKKLTDFRVYGQSLYALYDHYLYKYQLNF